MKVATLGESEADEAAVRVLVEGLTGLPVEVVDFRARPHGFSQLVRLIRPVFLEVFHRGVADALVVVVDSNDSPVHGPRAGDGDGCAVGCRLCQVHSLLDAVKGETRTRIRRRPLHTAAGLAVPAIEAWLLHPAFPAITEAAWVEGQRAQRLPYSRRGLKRQLYGTERPTLAQEKTVMVEAARRVVDQLDRFERMFPVGFGTFAADIRNWARPDAANGRAQD